jgi:DNA repair protein RadC
MKISLELKMENVNEGHRARLRERMKKEGLTGFQDHEVLELLLFYFIPRKDTNKIAHNLLNKFGNFFNLLYATPEQLMAIDGISEVTAYGILSLKEVYQRYVRSVENNTSLKGLNAIIQYAKKLVNESYTEKMVVVFVDDSTHFLSREEYYSETGKEVYVTVKSIVKAALKARASGVILFHCHVVGNCEPVDEELFFTEKLFITLANLDIDLLENLIFNRRDVYSYNKEKDIENIRQRYLRIMERSLTP